MTLDEKGKGEPESEKLCDFVEGISNHILLGKFYFSYRG